MGYFFFPLGCDDPLDDFLKNKTSRRAGVRSVFGVNKNITSCKAVHLCIGGGLCSVLSCRQASVRTRHSLNTPVNYTVLVMNYWLHMEYFIFVFLGINV